MRRRKTSQKTSGAFSIVASGKPRAAVVLGKDATPPLRAAAEDLVRVVEKMSGARLPVVAPGAAVEVRARILLGAEQAASCGVSLRGVGPEGHRVARAGADLVIAGAADEATAHGVYTLLQESLGVRWLMPGELWEMAPSRRSVSLAVRDRIVNPSFTYRVYSGIGDARWCARNRMTYDAGRLPHYGFGHNLKQIIKPSIHGKAHPEYFAEVNGKRFVPESDVEERSQPCFTNPDVIRLTVDAARRFYDEYPDRTTYSLCANDNMDYCTCARCAALDAPPRMHRNEPVHSDSYWHFVSQVAKEIAKSHPDRYLGCYAYWGTDLLPRKVRKLPRNVSVALTQDTSQHFDPAYRKADREALAGWARVAAHVGKYDYYSLGWLTPRYFPSLAAKDLRYCEGLGLAGIYCEAYPYWAITGPMVWLGAQLMWDAKADAEALLGEFMRRAFGSAARDMRAYYLALQHHWWRPRKGMWFQGLDKMRYETAIVSADIMRFAWRCLEDGARRASSDAGGRVKYISGGFEMSFLLATICDAARSAAERMVDSKEDAYSVLEQAAQVLSRLDEPIEAHRRYLLGDQAYTDVYYRGERFEHKISTWRQEIGELLGVALRRALLWVKGHLHPREIDAFCQDAAARLERIPAARELSLTGIVAG